MVDSLGGNLERVQRGDAGSDVLQRFTELFLFSLPLYGRSSILLRVDARRPPIFN